MVNSVLEPSLPEIPDPASPGTDALMYLPGYVLRRAANTMMARLAARLAPIDLRVSDASVLLLVADRRDMTSSEIGQVLDIQRANMVPLLGRLEKAGLIQRQPIDRKSQAIVLSSAGRERLEQVRQIVGQFEEELMEQVPSAHRAHFLPALQALLA
jgi:DNA-binding MarR family transcriptional regulator